MADGTLYAIELFNIRGDERGWNIWGLNTKIALKTVLSDGFFNRCRNKLAEGDEVNVDVHNEDEWARVKFIVTYISKEDGVVETIVADRLDIVSASVVQNLVGETTP